MITEQEALRNPVQTTIVTFLTADNELEGVGVDSPLPVQVIGGGAGGGDASAANQVIANASLDSIDSKLSNPLTVNVGLTNAELRASAVEVTSSDSILISNSSTTSALSAGATFTGTSTDVLQYSDITVACKTDQDGTLYLEFSPDGTNWDSSLSFKTAANNNEVHRLTRTRQYFRTRFTNTSASNQTFMRMQCIGGHANPLTSALNGVVQTDSDTLITRPMDFNLMVAQNLYQNNKVTIKDGLNSDVDTGSVPEDLDNVGGVYAGFPSAAAAAEIVVSGADTGTVWYSYLASDTDTDYTFASKEITNAGTYALGHNIWRCNYAYFVGASAINVGDITIRHTATPTNIFCRINAGIGQTYCAAYTVPYGSKIYLDRITGNMRGSTSGSMEGYFYYKPYGQSPYLRFPFELQFGQLYFDDVDYLIEIPERVDLIPRIVTSSVNNLSAKVSYRFVKVKL